MRILDPGHYFELNIYDPQEGDFPPNRLRFMKRCFPQEKYPGNTTMYSGTNLQEVFRALIARLEYLQWQDRQHGEDCIENRYILTYCKSAIYLLEKRAHAKHNSKLPELISSDNICDMPPCPKCGHVLCTWCEK